MNSTAAQPGGHHGLSPPCLLLPDGGDWGWRGHIIRVGRAEEVQSQLGTEDPGVKTKWLPAGSGDASQT